MSADRMRRVDEAMREVLSGAITSEIKDPRVGFVTVTAVETSPDLRYARVFVSVLGEEQVRRRSMAGLESAHGYLQKRVAGELRLKNTPTLQFLYDGSADRGLRIAELIDEEAGAWWRRTARAPPPRSCSTRSARPTASCSRPTSARTATPSARWPRCSSCSRRSAR